MDYPVGSKIRLTKPLHYVGASLNISTGTYGDIIPSWHPGKVAAHFRLPRNAYQLCVLSPEQFEIEEVLEARAITLWEPFASLIQIGAKRIETRSWETKYRGPLIIHASVRWNRDLELMKDALSEFPSARRLSKMQPQLGMALCMVDLVDCVRVETLNVQEDERAFGDYSAGRFGWLLENVRPFYAPIPAKGGQRLWYWRQG